MYRSNIAWATLVAIVLSMVPMQSYSQGLFGGILQGAGRALGIKPLEDLGRNADAEHKRLKDNVVIYKRIEEETSKVVQLPFSLACTAAFDVVVSSVQTTCSGFGSQSTAGADAVKIESAKNKLTGLGILSQSDFQGVSIRWCNGSFNGGGITPSNNQIILSAELKDSSIATATTIAHEMQHIFQYRRMGSGPFKCQYSQQFTRCGFCQDDRHPLENEAYTFENYAYQKLLASSPQETSASSFAPSNSLQAKYSRVSVQQLLIEQPPAPLPKVLTIDDLVKKACSVDGEIKGAAVNSCIDDLSIVYDDLQDTVDRDLEDDILGKTKDYMEASAKDRKKACDLVVLGIANTNIGKSKAERCFLRTNTFIRDAIADARSKKN